MPNFVVVVRCAYQRYVKADDPIDAIAKAINKENDDELWEWDYGIERVHIYDENDEQLRIRLPKATLAEINAQIKMATESHEEHKCESDDEDVGFVVVQQASWAEIRQEDIDEVPTISLAEAAKLSLELMLKEKIAEAVKEEPVEVEE